MTDNPTFPEKSARALVDAVIVGHEPQAETAICLASVHETALDPFNLFYFDNSGNPKSLTAAWNDLAFAGGSPFIAFINSDVITCPGWDRKLRTALEEHPDVGSVTPTAISSFPVQYLDRTFSFQPPPDLQEMEQLVQWAWEVGNGREHLYDFGNENGGYFMVMFRRHDFEELSGFDERLRFYGQDHEIQERLRSRSFKSAMVRTCPVYHGTGVSTNRAQKSGAIDIGTEEKHMSRILGAIREGWFPRWDKLSHDARKDIRKNPVYSIQRRSSSALGGSPSV